MDQFYRDDRPHPSGLAKQSGFYFIEDDANEFRQARYSCQRRRLYMIEIFTAHAWDSEQE